MNKKVLPAKKGFTHIEIIIAVVLITVIGVAGSVFYNSANNPNDLIVEQWNPDVVKENSWDEYSSIEGFTFQYPLTLTPELRNGVAEFYQDNKLAMSVYGYTEQSTWSLGVSYCDTYPEEERCEGYQIDGKTVGIDWIRDDDVIATANIIGPSDIRAGITLFSDTINDELFRRILSTLEFTDSTNDNTLLNSQ